MANEEAIKLKRREEPVRGKPTLEDDDKKKITFQLEPVDGEAPPPLPPIPPTDEDDRGRIIFELEPLPDSTWLPPETDYPDFPNYMRPDEKGVIVDIETTGVSPWESRIICISAKPAQDPLSRTETWINEDEEQLVRDFFTWFEAGGFEEIIGYNVSFDVRFLFATALRYRIKIPWLKDVELYDLMQVMRQVFTRFVYSFNKPGKLEEWTEYLLGVKKTNTIEEIFEAWAKKDYDLIVAYSRNDVDLEYQLLSLIDYILTP